MAFDVSVLSLAVMTLRQFEREAARKQDEMRGHLGHEHTKREVQDKQLKEMERDKNLLLVRLFFFFFLKQKTVVKNVVSVFISLNGLL